MSAAALGACTEETLARLNDPGIAIDRMIGPPFGAQTDWVALIPTDVEATQSDPISDRGMLQISTPPGAVTLRGDRLHRLLLHSVTWKRAQAAAGAGLEIWLEITPSHSAGLVLAVWPDGSVAFIGDCIFDIFTGNLRAYHAELAATGDPRSQRELILDLIDDPAQAVRFSTFLTSG